MCSNEKHLERGDGIDLLRKLKSPTPSETSGLPGWCSGKEPACQCRRCKRRGVNPWVGQIPWSRKWQPSPVFLPGESHGKRSLGLQSMESQRVRHAWETEHRSTVTRVRCGFHPKCNRRPLLVCWNCFIKNGYQIWCNIFSVFILKFMKLNSI